MTGRGGNLRLAGGGYDGRPIPTWCVWALGVMILLLSTAATARPVAAQDCSISNRLGDWDDIQRFRDCIEEKGLDAWSPWVLHQAARLTNNPTIVRLLLQAGADPNAPDDDGLSPLHHGARNSDPMVVRHLLDAGADLNARENDGYTPLHYAAAQSGNGRVIKLILDRGAEPLAESSDGRTPLHSALRYRADQGVVSALLDAGGAGKLTPLQFSALRGDSMAVSRLLVGGADPDEADPYGWTSLHFAVPLAGLGVVSALLEAGADPNGRTVSGATALHVAAEQASVEVVSVLLEAGTDPNVKTDDGGWTALGSAAQSRTEDLLPVIDALLHAGADPGASQESADRYGARPLHRAVMNSEVTVEVVRALLDAGADPRARTQNGNTPLHYAAGLGGDLGVIGTLLDAGADVRAQNDEGVRPVDVAWDMRGSEAWWLLVVPEGILVPGRNFSGSLSSSDEVWDGGSHYDVWSVSATSGQRVVIDMESDDVDSYLRVLRRDGTAIATDDHGASGSNARVEFGAPYAGEYLVIATSYEAGVTGTYRVRVR